MDTQNPPVDMLSFRLHQSEGLRLGPRLAQLAVRGRQPIQTPSYIANTSRGVLPHVTQDVLLKHTSVSALYYGLEDFIEKRPNRAPIFKSSAQEKGRDEGCAQDREPAHNASRLASFTATPEHYLTILGARRLPTVPNPKFNTHNSIAVSTSVGFSDLAVTDYYHAIKTLQPDVSASIADIALGDSVSRKRCERSVDRTHAWLRDFIEAQSTKDTPRSSILASIPPVAAEQQTLYLADLVDEYGDQISGLCLYSPDTAADLPDGLLDTLRICLCDPQSPHDVLRAVSLGIDLITVPFVTKASEAGVSFAFDFTCARNNTTAAEKSLLPLGYDIWTTDCSTDVSALAPACSCYTCTRHHKAYIHHLLQAREMLAWTLLQIHNFHTLHKFFRHIRESVTRGTFDEDSRLFEQAYDRILPMQTGEGPRIRGYQMKSVGGGEPKKNRKAYDRLDEQARKLDEAESGVAAPLPGESADDLEQRGFAAKKEDE